MLLQSLDRDFRSNIATVDTIYKCTLDLKAEIQRRLKDNSFTSYIVSLQFPLSYILSRICNWLKNNVILVCSVFELSTDVSLATILVSFHREVNDALKELLRDN